MRTIRLPYDVWFDGTIGLKQVLEYGALASQYLFHLGKRHPYGGNILQKENQIKKGTDTASVPFCICHKNKELKNISNFPPIIVYTIFVQIAIGKPKKFVYFSAKLLSIFLTIYWKSVFRSVIMDYANMIYVMQTRHQFGR